MLRFPWSRSRSARRRALTGRCRPRPEAGIERLERRLTPAITFSVNDLTGLDPSQYDVWITGHGIPGWAPAGSAPTNLLALTPSGTFAQAATSIQSATSSSTTATITTSVPHGLSSGSTAFIAGVSPIGYDGSYTISVTSPTTFTYTTIGSGLAAGSGGTAYSQAMIDTVSIATATTVTFGSGSGLAQFTTSAAHGLSVGQTIEVSGVSVAGYNGVYTVAQVPNPTTFQVTYTAGSALASGSGGTLDSVGLPAVNASALPGGGQVTLDTALTNYSAKFIVFVSATGASPNPLPFSGNGVTPTDPLTPPYAPAPSGVPPVTSVFDICEFAFLPWGATSSGTTATITTTSPHGLTQGASAVVSGVVDATGSLISGYNGTFTVANVLSPNQFTITTSQANLPNGGSGAVNSALTISSGFSTFDVSAVDGLSIPMSVTASNIRAGQTIASVGVRAAPGFNRAAIGDAYLSFMQNDPLGVASGFGRLLYDTQASLAPVALTGASWSNNAATFTTLAAHGLLANEWVSIAGVSPAGYNGTFQVSATGLTATSFQVVNTNSSLSGLPGTQGTVTPIVYQSPVRLGNQFFTIAAPKDWLANQMPNAGSGDQLAALDPLATFWDTTIANFFQAGNNLSIYLNKDPSNPIYSGSSNGSQYSLSNGVNTYTFPKPTGGSLANAFYVWSQANAPSGDQGLLQDQIWQALCRGVALDGVSTTSITNGQSTTAWTNNATWYTQHTSTAFPNFQSIYCPYSKFLHQGTLSGGVDTTGARSIFQYGAAYGFGEDENPIGMPSYTGPLVPSKLDGTVPDGATVTLRLSPWQGRAAAVRPAIDLNGDGIGDAIWRNTDLVGKTLSYTGTIYDASGNITSTRPLGGDGWVIDAAGYFTGSNVTDIVWRYVANGATSLWIMSADGSPASQTPLGGGGGWRIISSGDYSGDSLTDLVWEYTPTGACVMWVMAGSKVVTNAPIGGGAGWSLVTTSADFDANGDRRADIIWKGASGPLSVWLMNGVSQIGSLTLTGDAGYNLLATGQFNGDGIGDLVWRNPTTGVVSQWLMNAPVSGTAWTPSSKNTLTNTGFRPVQTVSFWGNTITWYKASAAAYAVWTMNGGTQESTRTPAGGGPQKTLLTRRPVAS
jgi:hypothetical protein